MARNNRKGAKSQREKAAANGAMALAPMFRTPTQILHNHVRRWNYGTLGRAAADQGFGFYFRISDLPNSSEFTSLYDHYKLAMVEIVFELVANTASLFPTETFAQPTVLITPDYDNATAPATQSVMEQYGQAERITMSTTRASFSRRIVPRVSIGTLSVDGGALAGAVVAKPEFIDCTYNTVPHYGLKFWISNYNNTTVADAGTLINVSFRYHLVMRNTR